MKVFVFAKWCVVPAFGLGLGLVVACSEDSTPAPAASTTGRAVGEPCTHADDCATSFCLTSDSFKSLTGGKEVSIPLGYCSKFPCTTTEQCGPGGFCFSLAQYPAVGVAVSVCAKVCESGSECRPGYVCHDGSGPNLAPQPKKACLTPELLCLLDIPQSICPLNGGTDGAPPDAASGDGATDAPRDVAASTDAEGDAADAAAE